MPVDTGPVSLLQLDSPHYGVCDICEAVVPLVDLQVIDNVRRGDHDHAPRICSQCWARIHSGEIDAELLLADDDA